MTFTVKYRAKDGSVAEETIEATDRADCFAKCRAQGMAVVELKVGSENSGRHCPTRHTRPTRPTGRSLRAKLLIAGFLLVAAGVSIWFWCEMGNRTAEKLPVNKVKEQKTQVVDTKPVVKPSAPNVERKSEVLSMTNQFPKRIEMGVEVVSSSARTNQSGAVIEKLRLADGRVIEKVTPPKPIFGNPSDQMIAVALSATPGQAVAPFPDLGSIDDDFKKSLSIPIRIEEGDSEETKELKLKVKEARAYIAAEIGQGKTAKQCLYEYREEMQRIADSHQMAINQIATMKKEGSSAAEISEFRTRINEYFREKGIAELPGLKNKNTEEKE